MNNLKRGDIFHDGLLGYWVIHEKPNENKLFILPYDKLNKEPDEFGCNDYWHELKNWKVDQSNIICNHYDHPDQARALLNDGNSLGERMKDMFKP